MECDPGEVHRRAEIQRCLEENKVDITRQNEVGGFLESILLLKCGLNVPVVTKKQDPNEAVVEGESTRNSNPSDTICVTHPIDRALVATESSEKDHLIIPDSNNLISPIEEKAADWGTESDSSSALSSPPGRILTPEGWSSRQSSGENMMDPADKSDQVSPTLAGLEMLPGYEGTNHSSFNALLDVANIAANELNYSTRDMTLLDVKAGGILLELDGHDRCPNAKNGQVAAAKSGMFATPAGKRETFTLGAYTTPTKQDLIQKMEDQCRRSGMKPAAALGATPVTPSSTTKYGLFAPNHNAFQKDQPPEFPVLTPSTARKSQDTGDDSDDTIADPNCSDGEIHLEIITMIAAEKKKKPVQSQYSGPPAYLLSPNRTDAVALAAKNNHLGSLNDLPSIISGPTTSFQHNESQVNPATTQSGPKSTNSQLSSFDGPCDTKHTLPPLHGDTEGRNNRHQISEPLGTLGQRAWYNEERDGRENRQQELDRLRAERKERDDKEMYEGLKAFEENGGLQRGWNGEPELLRQETLKQYHQEEEHKALAASEREKAAATPKAKTTIAGKQPSKPKYKSKEKILAGMAKELEDGYSERYAKEVQAAQDYDDHNRILAAKNHATMMRAPWDHDEIKRKALAEQATKILEHQRVKLRNGEYGTDMANERHKPNQIDVLTTNLATASHKDIVLFPQDGYMKNGEQLVANSKNSNPNRGKRYTKLKSNEDGSNPNEDNLTPKKDVEKLKENMSKLEAALRAQDPDYKPKKNKLKRKERGREGHHGKHEASMSMSEFSDRPVKKKWKNVKQEERRAVARGGKPKRQYVFQTGRYKISKTKKEQKTEEDVEEE